MLISTLMGMALATAPERPTPSKLLAQPCEFGEARQFSKVDCEIELRNVGDTPIRISNLSARRPNDTLQANDGLIVPANGAVHLDASVKIENEEGFSRFQFSFGTDEPGQEIRNAEVRGFVAGILDQFAPTIDFGIVNVGEPGTKKALKLSSLESLDFKITGVIEKPSYLDVSIGNDKRTVTASLGAGAPLGPSQTDFLKLSVNSPNQSQVWVKLKSDVRGDVVPSSNPFALGLMRTNNTNEYAVRLTSRSGAPFKVGPVSVEHIAVTAKIDDCIPRSKDCKLLRLQISNDQPTGQIGGIVRVSLPDTEQELPIYVWGMLLSPEVEVIDLGKEMEKNKQDKSTSNESAAPAVDIKNALKLAVRETNMPPPPGTGPLIKWSATNEQIVYGYAVYRADTDEGPFVRITTETIPALNKDNVGSKYQWRDNSAVSGKTYWYYIGLFNQDGSKQQLSSPQKVVAK